MMKCIKTWKDVAEFAGRFVAISPGGSVYFGANNGPYKKKDLVFAVISETAIQWSSGGGLRAGLFGDIIGFKAELLLNKDEIDGNTALIDGKLNETNLTMRLASVEELTVLKGLVIAGEAIFIAAEIYIPNYSIQQIDKALALLLPEELELSNACSFV